MTPLFLVPRDFFPFRFADAKSPFHCVCASSISTNQQICGGLFFVPFRCFGTSSYFPTHRQMCVDPGRGPYCDLFAGLAETVCTLFSSPLVLLRSTTKVQQELVSCDLLGPDWNGLFVLNKFCEKHRFFPYRKTASLLTYATLVIPTLHVRI